MINNIKKRIMIKLIICIGLPSSGKTTYCKNNFSDINIYDDFINNFYNGLLINDLELGNKICINYPRLCNYNTFKKYMEVFEQIIEKNDILLYLFENNKDICLNRKNEK